MTAFKSVTQRDTGLFVLRSERLSTGKASLALVDILVNGEKVDAFIADRSSGQGCPCLRPARACERLKEEIPRQMFKIAIQGAIGGEIISRTTISPFSARTLLRRCYGGDITRKRKLLEKQKKRRKKTDEDGGLGLHSTERLSGGLEIRHGRLTA